MAYHYEELGPERFQEFCQALLLAEFPNAQCLPIAQPDGGRDAFAIGPAYYHAWPSGREQVIFQVKFVRRDDDVRNESEFITDIIKSETPKIRKMIKRGIKKYYLLTNLRGSSHPGVGSVDLINKYLTDELGIESYCWWRSDLDRRLDKNSDVKWSYPDILRATDLLQALVEGRLGEAEERRRSAIHAYLVSQYEDDEDLKFKQVDLKSKMTDLFVDLPLAPKVDELRIKPWRAGRLIRSPSTGSYWTDDFELTRHDQSEMAANFFLRYGKNFAQKIVLEGAPGQGKSTVTQYLCQVMRMHLLGRPGDVARLPEFHRFASVRLPFRVDLRDFAKWMSGADPFHAKTQELSSDQPRSLEGFLAAQVRFFSGGQEFNVSDLIAIIKASHVLLALDGFDEVADVGLRRTLVAEITKSTTRIEAAGGYSVQTIVTSRPAAFAKSIIFPRESWTYLELLPLERRQVDEYARKWMHAKGMKPSDRSSLVKTLDVKLKEPHTKSLSRNPMQLTILLTLIYTRGSSLPEKRTAMYDSYMDLLFSRESEKNDVVREHRDLLVDIHRFLAWKLQTAAEAGATGSIDEGDLRDTLLKYLISQGEDTGIVQGLFDGVVERVGAIVSRVQGTYEFEVQPLREYFVARFLYETAPYSPVGWERSGTKLERFDALARNPYWLNVTRFYGGCFSKGEISALVDALNEISNTEPYRLTSHPRSLALMLLGDWVFTQYQPAVRRVIELITSTPEVRQLLAAFSANGENSWPLLPDRCGRTDLLESFKLRLLPNIPADERRAICAVIRFNSTYEERLQIWRSKEETFSEDWWAIVGDELGIFSSIEYDDIAEDAKTNRHIINLLISNERFDLLVDQDLLERAKAAIFSRDLRTYFEFEVDGGGTFIEAVGHAVGLYKFGYAFGSDQNRPFKHELSLRFSGRGKKKPANKDQKKWNHATEVEREALAAYDDFASKLVGELSSSLSPWTDLIESYRAAWGEQDAFYRISALAAGVKSKDDEIPPHLFIMDSEAPLMWRARVARLKSGAPRWWYDQLEASSAFSSLFFPLLMLWIWATPKTLIKLGNDISAYLDNLPENEWLKLGYNELLVSRSLKNRPNLLDLAPAELRDARHLSPRGVVFLGRRVSGNSRSELISLYLAEYDGTDALVWQFISQSAAQSVHKPSGWKSVLPMLGTAYRTRADLMLARGWTEGIMSTKDATRVASDPAGYPLAVVGESDISLRSFAGSSAPKLLDVAVTEKWF